LGRTNHLWKDEERDIIRRDYQHTHASRDRLAQRLGVPPYAVAGQISAMGIAKRNGRRPWTAEEDEKLRELAQKFCPRRVQKIMHRSLNSVVLRMKRLKIYRRYRNGWYTKREVCEILGVDHKWVQARINSGALKAAPHDPHTPPQKYGSGCWHITEESLREFICRYPEELNGKNTDLMIVVDLLTGKNV